MSRQVTKKLCGTCAELLRRGYNLRKIAGGVDNKITCDNCGKRRYGATYGVTPKRTVDRGKSKLVSKLDTGKE